MAYHPSPNLSNHAQPFVGIYAIFCFTSAIFYPKIIMARTFDISIETELRLVVDHLLDHNLTTTI